MTPLFLLKLISELLDGTPTKDQIECAKKIVKQMIEEPMREMEQVDKESLNIMNTYGKPLLDEEAQKAKMELMQ